MNRQRNPGVNILRKLGVVRRRTREREAPAPGHRRMADGSFRCDMNGLRAKFLEHAQNPRLWEQREPDGRIGRTRIRRKTFWGDELDLMTKLSPILGGLAQRSDDSVDLRVPRIRCN